MDVTERWEKFSIVAIIMASGNSTRFGDENKLLYNLNGVSIFENVLITVFNSHIFNEIIVVTCFEEVKKICEKYEGVKVVENHSHKNGISESIKLGIKNTTSFIDSYMFIQADQPYISCDTLIKLYNKFTLNHKSIIIPTYEGVGASPKIFAKVFKTDLLNLQEDCGGKEIVKKNLDKVVYVKIENPYEIRDIDYKEDVE